MTELVHVDTIPVEPLGGGSGSGVGGGCAAGQCGGSDGGACARRRRVVGAGGRDLAASSEVSITGLPISGPKRTTPVVKSDRARPHEGWPLQRLVPRYFSRPVTEFVAEAFGTMMITCLGTSAVSSAVLAQGLQGLWQVAAVWGFAVALAIYVTNHLSGAHLNPAVSLAFCLLKPHQFPLRKLLLYITAQVFGAFVAGWITYSLYHDLLQHYESDQNITRGDPGSERSAMVLCQYFPNPGLFGNSTLSISLGQAFWVEMFGTFILVAVIFSLNDPCNNALRQKELAPYLIGFTVATLISVLAPLTQAGFNPARDFGPRLVAACLGWDTIAFPGPSDGFWVYIVGPMVGGPLGALFTRFFLERPCLSDEGCPQPPAKTPAEAEGTKV
eukprot:m.56556 g.56556  ORF g.56556 m.56556 type:complete len:386 (-) comp12626_c0_seq2:246-1403(-)